MVVVCSCFVASGPGRLVVVNGTLNFALYPKILKEYLAISLWPEAQAELGYATKITQQQVHLIIPEEKKVVL